MTDTRVDTERLRELVYKGDVVQYAKLALAAADELDELRRDAVEDHAVMRRQGEIVKRLKWWLANMAYKAPEQMQDTVNAMLIEMQGMIDAAQAALKKDHTP